MELYDRRNKKVERNKVNKTGNPIKLIKLTEIKTGEINRMSTRIAEFDRVLGGGLVPGMAVLLAGEPGIGKSTLLLQLANSINSKSQVPNSKQIQNSKTEKVKQDLSFEFGALGLTLYIAGEESAAQIKIRAERLGVEGQNLEVLESTDVDDINSQISNLNSQIGVVIVDSIQTLTTGDLSGTAGSVGQVRECAARLIGETKSRGIPLIMVGHVTKDGTIAGPKVLEHIVDTVLTFEGEMTTNFRVVRATKNRFGPTDEVGVFEMGDKGLVPALPPVPDAEKPQPGSCLTVVMEGTRPMMAEIQALVTSTPLPNPRRVASGIDYNRLLTIVAILQKRLNLPLYKEDIYVSVSGGLKITEPAADLAVAIAIISSFQNKAWDKCVAWGELDLLGNVRPVVGEARREKEAKSFSLTRIYNSKTMKQIRSKS